MKLKDLKNLKLEKLKTLIDLTVVRSAGKQGIDWLISKEIKTVGDLLSSKTIDRVNKKIQNTLQIYSEAELIQVVHNEVQSVIEKDPSYEKDTIEEMIIQHTACWVLLLQERLYILRGDLEKENAVIWCKGFSNEDIGI
ncbi:hypothetical protein [Peribacillus frigoritolerans]|uniref:hypothetical protein n=1 Tax=Peribacillus frigoritolerans TaxID=450367 RepID=UPI0022821060|nr:hypothetical protein [Peribacillus frigoritolerans]MCY9140508.1 hypothetical protein [Peribacillus frigoritolerans]